WLAAHLKTWDTHPRAGDLRCEAAAGPLWARAQPQLLAQALDNLLDNAAKYSAPGTPITLRAGRVGDDLWLAVEDEGPGVAPEGVPRRFGAFSRSEQGRRSGTPGVGLGLAVAARVAAAFGGRVAADSRPGRGSRFTIHLPAAAPPG